MNIVISTSLNPGSRSRLLAREAFRVLEADGLPAAFVDLQEMTLPLCDGGASYGHPSVRALAEQLAAARSVLLATPIYNYTGNAVLKNLIELTGGSLENKVVGFLCAAGGLNSYMSIMPVANSLMLDFRCVIVPRFVYATEAAFAGDSLRDMDVLHRIAELARAAARMGESLQAA